MSFNQSWVETIGNGQKMTPVTQFTPITTRAVFTASENGYDNVTGLFKATSNNVFGTITLPNDTQVDGLLYGQVKSSSVTQLLAFKSTDLTSYFFALPVDPMYVGVAGSCTSSFPFCVGGDITFDSSGFLANVNSIYLQVFFNRFF